MDKPACYEHAARVERESALQGSVLVRTVGSCAQRRVALMPQAIATARDALSNDQCESAARFERAAKQVQALATEPRVKREVRSVLCHTYQKSGSNIRAEQERRHCTLSWSCLL